MTSPPPPALFMVLADPSPEREADFHHWYDVVHGPDALANGSFSALRRFRAVGDGWVQARYLALWEGHYASEKEAWDYIAPRAEELRQAGRVGDEASVVWAAMLFGVPDAPGASDGSGTDPVMPTTLTTVQNDWRSPDPTLSAAAWWQAAGLDKVPASHRRSLYGGDPLSRGAGRYLAIFEQQAPVTEVAAAWAGSAAAGMSPMPPYQPMFVDAPAPGADRGAGAPGPAPAWIMHWEPVSNLPSATS